MGEFALGTGIHSQMKRGKGERDGLLGINLTALAQKFSMVRSTWEKRQHSKGSHCVVDLKKYSQPKSSELCVHGGNFRNSRPGGSISSDPERTAMRR